MAENAIRPPKQIGLNELNKEGWESWLESFEWYEIATQLSSKAPEVQVAIFMAAMGREAQNIFKSFNLNNADKNNLSIVKDKFNNYFSPKLNTTIERFKFNQMKQKEDESFNDFLTRIKLQIANCKYAVMSDELLKDRIVVGIINNEIRERLLSEADLNLGKATQICIACENATNQMKHVLSDSDKQVAVTKMNSKKWEDRKGPRKENTNNQSHKIIENCRNCGRSHKINQCPAYQKRCNKCKKLNHFANLCRSKNTNSYKIRQIVGSPEPEMIQEFVIQSVENTNLTEDWYEEVKIKGKKVNMKLDTGAQCNVLPLSLAGRLNLEIQRSPVKSLISFSGHRIPVEGQSLAMCMVKNMTAYIRFIISRDNTCPILGRQTCSNLGLVKRVNTCQVITQEYQELFEGIGCLKGYEYEAKFQTSDMNMQVRPPRPIPLSIKESVKKELEEMEDNGIIKKVNYPTPISSQMVIAKQKGKIRICIDPSDINKVILRSHFPLRTFDQIAVNLHGSKYFTKLDLKKGYWQIKVAPNSQRYFTFSTPWGRYMFLRVPFGIKTAPEIFQKIMADLLQDLEGHIVTTEGIKIDPEKVRAIGEIKSPSNKQELQRLLGMVQYLSRFIPNLAEKTKNMRLLLKKDTPWLWDESLDCDLLEIKTLLRTAPTLKFFNPNGNLTLSVDASSYALGAVLLQNGKPIAYASSALNSTQQNYAQIEKEALAIKFGCDKFHQLIYGKTVDVETDHRPLETIFKKPLSKAPPRLQRIFLQIQQYDLRIKYKKGKELLTADLLSRDCSYEDTYLEENFEVLMTTPTNKSSYEELQALTKEDQELQELKNLILYGWSNYKSAVPESCKKYWPYRDELSTNEDLIFKAYMEFPDSWKLIMDQTLRPGTLKTFKRSGCSTTRHQVLYILNQTGLAERAVQTAKNLIRKCLDSGQEVELALLNFYNTPRDGLPSPAQCLFSRRTRTLLPTSTHQLEPEIQKGHTQNLRNKREKQKTHHDKTAKTTRSFKEGENIMLKQHHREWIPARVTQEVAPRSYKVQTPTGEYRRNSSFMRHTNLESPKQQRRRIPEIPKSTLPEGPGPSGDKEQAQVPEELNTSPRAFTGQEPRSDHQNAEHKNGTLPITTRISEHCEYANLRDELIRDRIVLGVKDRKLSEKLMLNENLNLAKAVEIARQWEAVMREQQDLNPSTSQVDTTRKLAKQKPKASGHGKDNGRSTSRQTDSAKETDEGNKSQLALTVGLPNIIIVTEISAPLRTRFFGISSAPEHFQKRMSAILRGINGGRFVPNLAEITKPLNDLRKKDVNFIWGSPQKKAFEKIKDLLASDRVLASFDISKKTMVSADASSYGLGAGLKQEHEANEWRPVAFASRTLTKMEQGYAQIEKEALAITWACERFKDFVGGKTFLIETDHKPLVPIFTTKDLNDLTPRLQRYRMRMLQFSFHIFHTPGKDLITADALSRQPLPGHLPEDEKLQEEVEHFVRCIVLNQSTTDDRLSKIALNQKLEPTLQNVAFYSKNGWPAKCQLSPLERSFYDVREEIGEEHGILMRGLRVIIPSNMRKDVLNRIHAGHQGITKCRARAKDHVWWPGIAQEIQDMVKTCEKCIENQPLKHEPLIPNDFPEQPWQKVEMDLFHYEGREGEEEQRKMAQKTAFDRRHAATKKAELIADEKVWAKCHREGFSAPLIHRGNSCRDLQ
ncbi:K02A2.6-like, partial [Cordylochernes scorpioides]